MLTWQVLHKIARRGVAEIIGEDEFGKRLMEGLPLRLKMGFDPSSPDIHLGHVVGLRKLRQLQELGHQVILIVGDWTARRMLTQEEVERNAETYMRQFFKVVDPERTELRRQSEWFGSFDKRFRGGKPITELLYPLLQAYDSVAVEADVEIGGTDQKFNLLVGRELQVMEGQRPQQCLLVPLLVGTDGVQKMSKSLGNYIGVEEPPREQYGKVMSIRDDLIISYFDLLTDVEDAEVEKMRQALEKATVNPMKLKKRLAREIVGQLHGACQRGEY